MNILIFGARGYIGSFLSKRFEEAGHNVLRVDRATLNFGAGGEDILIRALIQEFEPDVVINAVGEIDVSEAVTPQIMFSSLLLPSLLIFRHFKIFGTQRKVRILTFGSTSEGEPRKNYPMYAALKTAEATLISTAVEEFLGTEVSWFRLKLPRLGGGLGIENPSGGIIISPTNLDSVWLDVTVMLEID